MRLDILLSQLLLGRLLLDRLPLDWLLEERFWDLECRVGFPQTALCLFNNIVSKVELGKGLWVLWKAKGR